MYEHICAGALESQKRASDSLELELQEVVNLVLGTRNKTWILWKSSKHSYMLSCLSSPYFNHLILFY